MGTRTNIVLDDDLVEKAMTKAGVTTKKAAVETALRDYVREPDWKGLLALEGSGALADDYDPSKLFDSDRELHEPVASYRVNKRKATPVVAKSHAGVATKSSAAIKRK